MQLSRHVLADADLLFDIEVKKTLCVMTNLVTCILQQLLLGCDGQGV